jgi:Lhr-like helicase
MDDRTDPSRPAARAATYDRDLYSWAVEQAALLRAGKIAEADALNIAEELDDVGNEQYDKLESALRLILVHLLKWDHQPDRRSRNWRLTISVQRKHVLKVLRKNPGLKSVVDEAMTEAYDLARTEAAGETLLEEEDFPVDCPYSWNEIMERPIEGPQQD